MTKKNTKAVATVSGNAGILAASGGFTGTPEQVELVKKTIAVGTTNDELALFLYTAKKTGLDPLARQIYAIKRYDSATGGQKMSIQVGIDGYRLIADRTGRYAPGRVTLSLHDNTGKPVSATAVVKKKIGDEWHEVEATAYFDEYVQTKKGGQPTHMWATKPKLMLQKCAEALALRKAFPAELSGVYTAEEMPPADAAASTPPAATNTVGKTRVKTKAAKPSHAAKTTPEDNDDNAQAYFWANAKKLDAPEAWLRDAVKEVRGKESTSGITRDEADQILAILKAKTTEPEGAGA